MERNEDQPFMLSMREGNPDLSKLELLPDVSLINGINDSITIIPISHRIEDNKEISLFSRKKTKTLNLTFFDYFQQLFLLRSLRFSSSVFLISKIKRQKVHLVFTRKALMFLTRQNLKYRNVFGYFPIF